MNKSIINSTILILLTAFSISSILFARWQNNAELNNLVPANINSYFIERIHANRSINISSIPFCPISFSRESVKFSFEVPCSWSSCTLDPSIPITEYESGVVLTVQAASSCALGMSRFDFGSTSEVDIDISYFNDTGLTLEQWVPLREKNIKPEGLEFSKTFIQEPAHIILEAVDNNHRYDLTDVYDLSRVYWHKGNIMYEMSFTIPHARSNYWKDIKEKIINSFISN